MIEERYEYQTVIDRDTVIRKLGKREETGYKGDFGTLFCLCGSVGMSGAAIMSMSAALKCGVGIVRGGIPRSIYEIAAKNLLEPVFVNLPENDEGTVSSEALNVILNNKGKATAMLVGCGLGRNEDINNVVSGLIKNLDLPIVLDADGINAISENINILNKAKHRMIITPHIGEMARLLNVSTDDIIKNKSKYAKELSQKYGIVVVLKGSDTIISDEDGKLFVNRRPNSGMSKGGNGDVLSGIIASFLAQGMTLIDSAICGVYIHSLAGMRCREKLSETAMLPTDVIEQLPNIFLEMNR